MGPRTDPRLPSQPRNPPLLFQYPYARSERLHRARLRYVHRVGHHDAIMSDTLLVVAAGPGLGAAIARRFAREGTAVGLVARSAERLGGLVDELRALDVPVEVAEADVADTHALRSALADLRRRLGEPDVLVYNGSEYVEGRPTEVPPDAVLHAVQVGVTGALVAVQEVAPAMRAAGRGTILLTGSEAAVNPYPGAAAVGIAKAGLRNLALSLEKELAPEGVHVTTVTIRGVLKPGTAFDPEVIAERYWELQGEPADRWRPEVEITR